MDKDLMAAYGEACVALEVAQKRHQELKKKVIAEMSKPVETEKEKEDE